CDEKSFRQPRQANDHLRSSRLVSSPALPSDGYRVSVPGRLIKASSGRGYLVSSRKLLCGQNICIDATASARCLGISSSLLRHGRIAARSCASSRATELSAQFLVFKRAQRKKIGTRPDRGLLLYRCE